MAADLHVHTRFSCDARETMERYCEAALAAGLDTLCFTDHCDNNPRDEGFGFYDAAAYFEALARARERYAGRLTLLAGLEFGEPHRYGRELERLLRRPYDLVIGSVHFWLGDRFPSELVRDGVPAEACCEAYWDEVERMVDAGGFDVVGHLDLPKRYYGTAVADEGRLRALFLRMAERGLVLECNTSSLRRGVGEAMPGAALLRLYREAGGARVTLGSDAHRAEELGADFDRARAAARALGLVCSVRRRAEDGAARWRAE